MKTENTVTWLTITWYWELFIYKHENNVQTRGKHTSKRGKKRYETSVIGPQESKKKYEIWYFSQVAKVCLFKEFGSFPPTPIKK